MSIPCRTRALFLCASAALFCFGQISRATDRSWITTNGSFHLGINWGPFPGAVPGAGDRAIFDNGAAGTYTVSFSSSVTNSQLLIGRDELYFGLTGLTYNLTSTSALPANPGITIGETTGDVAHLFLDGGTLSGNSIVIGKDAGSNGTVDLFATATFRANTSLDVGYDGSGGIFLGNGSTLSTASANIATRAGSSGFVTMSGTGQWLNSGALNVGVAGNGGVILFDSTSLTSGTTTISGTNGSLSVRNASAFTPSTLFVGDNAGGIGRFHMIDTSTSKTGFLWIHDGSVGDLDGGTLRVPQVRVDGQLDVAAPVTLAIDSVSVTGGNHFAVGVTNQGTLDIEGGGVTNIGNAYVGERAGSRGVVIVQHAGASWTNTGFLDIGSAGHGELSVSLGAALSANDIYLAPFPTADSFVSVNDLNSTFRATNSIFVGGLAGTTSGGPATMVIRNQAAVSAGTLLRVHTPGTVNLESGTITVPILDVRGLFNHTAGVLKVTDGAATPSTTGIYVGIGGVGSSGTLTVNAGGRLNTVNNAVIAQSTGSSGNATISGAGSRWTQAGDLSLATSTSTNATMSINSGGVVTNSGQSSVAGPLASTATVSITGAGSLWDITGPLGFATNGTGTINVLDGAVLRNANAYLAAGTNGNAQLNVNTAGATWNTNGGIFLGGNEVTAGGHALLRVGVGSPSAGGVVNATTGITVWPNAQIQQDSGNIVTPNITVNGGTVTQNGGYIVGPSASLPSTAGTYIGNGATPGTLTITSAGQFTTTGQGDLAFGFGSNAVATVDGAGSTWTINGPQAVGNGGHGTLTITNKGFVNTLGAVSVGLGGGSEGQVIVDGSSSRWTMGGQLDVADFGTASVNITNSALVSTGTFGFVGRYSGKGSVLINGALSEWRVRDLFIGGDLAAPGNTGLVRVENSGKLTVTNSTTIWAPGTLQMYPTSITTTELRLRGGTISAYGNIIPPLSNGGGTLDVPASQNLFISGPITSFPGAQLLRTGEGVAVFTGIQSHGPGATLRAKAGQTIFNTNAGTPATAALAANANLSITIGPDPAYVALNSDEDIADLSIDPIPPGRQSLNLFSPTPPGSFRSLRIHPNTTSKAALWAAIASANRPGAPDPLDGIFDTSLASHPNSGIGLAKVTDAHGDTLLLIRPARIGDLNLDGTVTIADFIDLASNFNASGPNITWQEGDLNYDNAVTIADFIDLAANFGASYSGEVLPISAQDQQLLSAFAAAEGASVPEPALLLLLPLGFFFRRRFKEQRR